MHGFDKIQNFDVLTTSFLDLVKLGSKLSLILIILAEVERSLFLLIELRNHIAAISLICAMYGALFTTRRRTFRRQRIAVSLFEYVRNIVDFRSGTLSYLRRHLKSNQKESKKKPNHCNREIAR
jgi:uncharacterized membrane protein YphA (DoxX/SURF4 family)